jgi:hypothetical protein
MYSAAKQSDQASRAFWDKLIDVFTEKALGNALLPGSSSHLSEIEMCLRVMASEPRLVRRALTRAFIDSAFRLRPKFAHMANDLRSTQSRKWIRIFVL